MPDTVTKGIAFGWLASQRHTDRIGLHICPRSHLCASNHWSFVNGFCFGSLQRVRPYPPPRSSHLKLVSSSLVMTSLVLPKTFRHKSAGTGPRFFFDPVQGLGVTYGQSHSCRGW